MIDITHFAKRIRRRTLTASALFLGGATMLVIDFTTPFPTTQKGEFALLWFFLIALGGFFYYRSMELPTKEVMQLAENKKGLLTLGEITTSLDISPDTTRRTLHYLQNAGITSPRWQELQKNLWEFPDYLQLPLSEAIELARKNKGRLALEDLLATGHTMEVAQETFSLLHEKGLAHPDPAAPAALLLPVT